MSEGNTPRLGRAPFWFADALLLGTAATLVVIAGPSIRSWEMLAVVACVAIGAWLSVIPVLREYDATVRLAESGDFAATLAKLQQLDAVAERIAAASSQWQAVQDRATQTAEQARGVVDRLAREAETFATAVSRTADGEKQTLKLEAEKLRRGESEWLQAVGRVMDHVFALHVAAHRSGQPALAEQIERFHAACRDALRRVGFVPVVASPDEPFDPRKHQCADGARPREGARIDETIAAGFLYQGQMLRPIIVKVSGPEAGQAVAPDLATPADTTADAPERPASDGSSATTDNAS